MSTKTTKQRSQWANELDNLIRGASGGFLFGIPLLYTMEVWWVGTFIGAQRMLLALLITYALVFVLNRMAGFRKTGGSHLSDVVISTHEAMAVSLICTAAVLFVLRRITLETPLDEALGKVAYEAMPFALGVAITNHFLSSPRSGEQAGQHQGPHSSQPQSANRTSGMHKRRARRSRAARWPSGSRLALPASFCWRSSG